MKWSNADRGIMESWIIEVVGNVITQNWLWYASLEGFFDVMSRVNTYVMFNVRVVSRVWMRMICEWMDSIGGWNAWNGTSFLFFPLPSLLDHFVPPAAATAPLVDGGWGGCPLWKKTVIFSPNHCAVARHLIGPLLSCKKKTFVVRNFYWCSRWLMLCVVLLCRAFVIDQNQRRMISSIFKF
jgi:hypothetical protein